jgi:hypothetical protein
MKFGDVLKFSIDKQRSTEKHARSKGMRFTKYATPDDLFEKKLTHAEQREARFIVNNEGVLWLGICGARSHAVVHHDELAISDIINTEGQQSTIHRDPVIAAGTIEFTVEGKINGISNSSGHYKPDGSSLCWLVLVLDSMKDDDAYQLDDTVTITYHQEEDRRLPIKWHVSEGIPAQFNELITQGLQSAERSAVIRQIQTKNATSEKKTHQINDQKKEFKWNKRKRRGGLFGSPPTKEQTPPFAKKPKR